MKYDVCGSILRAGAAVIAICSHQVGDIRTPNLVAVSLNPRCACRHLRFWNSSCFHIEGPCRNNPVTHQDYLLLKSTHESLEMSAATSIKLGINTLQDMAKRSISSPSLNSCPIK